MTNILETAIAQLRQLPEEDRDRLAREMLDRIAEEKEWDQVVGSAPSLLWLEKQADKITGKITGTIRQGLDHPEKSA